MKKKIINGILLVAMLFATTSAFVSCKDTDSDYKAQTDAQIAKLEKQLADLQTLVNGIKGCDCASKIAALEEAIKAIKVPSLDGYVKTEDLPAEVQKLLEGYLTEEQVKKLLADYALKTDIPEVKDVDLSDYFTKDQITEMLKEYAKSGDIKEIDLSKYLTADEIKELLKNIGSTTGVTKEDVEGWIEKALENYVNETKLSEYYTITEIDKMIQDIIKNITSDVNTAMVTSISVDQVVNPMFSFNTPFGVEANVLLTYFGDKARRDLYFPKGSEEPIVYKGEYIIEGLGNAGKIYVTLNPSTINGTGKTVKLVTTGGDESPVELTPLKASTENLMFLNASTRGDNAFYETFATIPAEKLAKAYISWEPENMDDFKEQIKELFKGHAENKKEIVEMIRTLYNLIINNNVPAYRMQVTWGEGIYTYSKANIAAVAMKPLSYSFDLSDEAEYNGEAITALEKLESKSVRVATKTASTQAKIWRFLDRFNIYADKAFQNINWAIQPTLLVSEGDEVSHPDVYEDVNTFTRYKAGEIKFLPTSWSAEVLAPAFKKLVVITSVDGTPVKADDPVNAGLLGQVVPGSVKEIPFTIEAGKTYKVQYSAMDFEGNIRTLNYVIKGSIN